MAVLGLIWKGQQPAEDRKRVLPEGPGCGSSLVVVQGVRGKEGITFCRLSLGYADGTKVSWWLESNAMCVGVISDDTPPAALGSTGQPGAGRQRRSRRPSACPVSVRAGKAGSAHDLCDWLPWSLQGWVRQPSCECRFGIRWQLVPHHHVKKGLPFLVPVIP